MGELAYSGIHGLTSALREVVTPHTFFEALGIRYVGPIDGHDIAGVEQALANAAEWPGPIVVHVLTQKGRGYAPAEEDDVQRLHDVKVKAVVPDGPALDGPDAPVAEPEPGPLQNASLSVGGADIAPDLPVTTYTHAFTRALLLHGEADPRIVAITAAMPGPTGLLPFEARFPERFVDVGIAEQHAVTAAAGMAMTGLRPVVAVYSTFFCRAFDQANLDVGLHRLPVVLVLDRAGITGDDGPSHHGVLDMALSPVDPGHDRLRPVVGARGRGHAGHRPDPRRAGRHPLPEDAGAARRPRLRGVGPRGPPGPGGRRIGLHPGRREDARRRRGRRPTGWPTRGST